MLRVGPRGAWYHQPISTVSTRLRVLVPPCSRCKRRGGNLTITGKIFAPWRRGVAPGQLRRQRSIPRAFILRPTRYRSPNPLFPSTGQRRIAKDRYASSQAPGRHQIGRNRFIPVGPVKEVVHVVRRLRAPLRFRRRWRNGIGRQIRSQSMGGAGYGRRLRMSPMRASS